jgi:hypothetical protein
MTSHNNIIKKSTPSYPSKGENRSKNRPCKRALRCKVTKWYSAIKPDQKSNTSRQHQAIIKCNMNIHILEYTYSLHKMDKENRTMNVKKRLVTLVLYLMKINCCFLRPIFGQPRKPGSLYLREGYGKDPG